MYKIIGKRRSFFVVSLVIIVLGLISLATRGLNLGIDFTSGTLVQLEFEESITASEIEEVLGTSEVANLGVERYSVRTGEDGRIAFIRTDSLTPFAQNEMVNILRAEIGDLRELSIDKVDPVIGGELVRRALIAVVIASLAVLAYVAFRFEYRFGVSAVAALVHDVLIVLSIFSITQVEINSPFVAAILTVVGYSVNDTIVIFDRIRENLRRTKTKSFEELVDISINQTLVRTLYTSVTTLVVVLSLHLFGAEAIRDLTLAFLIGVLVGTYSSIFVASSIWVEWREKDRLQAVTATE